MKPCLVYFLLILCLPFRGQACEGHTHTVKLSAFHTRAIKPYLPQIAVGTLNSDSAFTAFVESFNRSGAHVEEAYAVLGLKDIKHYDLLALFKTKTGKDFKQDAGLSAYIENLVKIRSQHPYMSSCADIWLELRVKSFNEEKDTVLREAKLAMIDFYEEDGSFWDVAMHTFALEAKSTDAVRRDTWDLQHFSMYYMALRQLGLPVDHAHVIASLETAYAAVQCKNCGVW